MSNEPNIEAGAWLSVSDLAASRGLAKATVSERVSRLVQAGLVSVRPGAGRTKLVNVAEFDRAVGDTTDLGQAASAKVAKAAEPSNSGAYTAEQARHMAYKADLARLDLEERLGKLVPVDQLSAACRKVAEVCVRQLGGLPGRADAMAAAVAKDGVTGARSLFRQIEVELREAFCRELETLAEAAQSDVAGQPARGEELA